MNNLNRSPDESGSDVILWEMGRAVRSSDAGNDMPVDVVFTSACTGLNSALADARIQGDIRYILALPTTAEVSREARLFDSAPAISTAAPRWVGLLFIVVDPQVEGDLSVASSVSRIAREAGLFVVALAAQSEEPPSDGKLRERNLLQAFDSVIALHAARPEAQQLACRVIKHIAGGLRVAPPVCTDLADVQGILRGAVVSIGVGEAEGPHSTGQPDRAFKATARAIVDAGRSALADAAGVIVAIAGNHSIRLSEIYRVTHRVAGLVVSPEAFVIPTVRVDASASDGFRVLLLVA
ncbi:FtsZ family protein [Paraburkholderia sp. GV068]|uniref:hypothetical protein n=1 Tax=unclassified Paraburkholderia TaxID=2615204 RepID=UPI000D3111B4|nr:MULTISPECIES: hypothetical protein [unclassified Paraburkholderia]PTR03791.1 FtsZ family protein [Paraburkholderia sp. GV072]PUB08749.1 FtsZ family protein [Paraburkholderia sp. GV068]